MKPITKNNDRDPENERTGDQHDSARDEVAIDRNDMKDIPGQEHIHPPASGASADTTITPGEAESYTLEGGKTNPGGKNATQGIP